MSHGMSILIAFALLLCMTLTQAIIVPPEVAFAIRAGGLEGDTGKVAAMAYDDGHVIIAGENQGNMTLGTQLVTPGIFIAKFHERTGECLWVTQIPTKFRGDINSVRTDTQGSIYAAGFVITQFSTQRMFVSKMDSEGNSLWLNIATDNNAVSSMNDLALDDTFLYATCFFSSNITFGSRKFEFEYSETQKQRVAVMKMNRTSGDVIDATVFEHDEHFHPSTLTVSTDGSALYLAGKVAGNITFCPGFEISSSEFLALQAFILALDKDWNCKWLMDLGGAASSLVNEMKIADGFLYAVGILDRTFNIGSETLELRGSRDSFVAKLVPETGEVVWIEQIGGTGNAMASSFHLEDSRICVVGTFTGNTFFDVRNAVAREPKGKTDSFLVCYDTTSGKFLWITTIGEYDTEAETTGITGRGGNLYVTGSFTETLFVDSYELQSEGKEDLYLIRYSNHTCFGISFANSSVCSEHGVCIAQDNCVCRKPYSGLDCSGQPTQESSGTELSLSPSVTVSESAIEATATHSLATLSSSLPENSEQTIILCYGIEAGAPSVCSGNGTCIAQDTCQCFFPYSGDECDIPATVSLIKQENNSKKVGVAVGVSIGVFFLILIVIAALLVLFVALQLPKNNKRAGRAINIVRPEPVTV